MTYIDSEELSVRIAEACMGNQRPKGFSARESMAQLRKLSPEYIAECCNADMPGSVEVKGIIVDRGAEDRIV